MHARLYPRTLFLQHEEYSSMYRVFILKNWRRKLYLTYQKKKTVSEYLYTLLLYMLHGTHRLSKMFMYIYENPCINVGLGTPKINKFE